MFFDVDAIGAGVAGEVIGDIVDGKQSKRWTRNQSCRRSRLSEYEFNALDSKYYIVQHGQQLMTSHRALPYLTGLVEGSTLCYFL
jgi:hypothetical protein